VNTLRVAVRQCAPVAGDVAANLALLDDAARLAAVAGAGLLLMPEMALTGYAIGADAVERLAEPADGRSADAVAAIARRHELAIVYGYPERDAGGLTFNAAQCIDANGRRLANHRKTHLFGDLDRAQFSAGAALSPVFELGGWRLGLLICYEIEFAETARALALQGVDLIAAPTANMLEFDIVATTVVATRAYENPCYVAYANHCGREGSIAYGGLSGIASPDGTFLAQAGRDDALIVAELDLTALQAARARLPYLADRRAELY
jgi:predicted amidohydrolase